MDYKYLLSSNKSLLNVFKYLAWRANGTSTLGQKLIFNKQPMVTYLEVPKLTDEQNLELAKDP